MFCSNSDAVDDNTGMDSGNPGAACAFGNRHFDTDEVVLHRAVAHGIVFANVGIALRNGHILRRAVVERHFDTKFESWPKRKVGKELKDKILFLDRIYMIYRITDLLLKSCQSC